VIGVTDGYWQHRHTIEVMQLPIRISQFIETICRSRIIFELQRVIR